MNLLHFPFLLSTSISHQCFFTNNFVKYKPSPKLLLLVFELSSCQNLSHILSIFVFSIHTQVSFTTNSLSFKTNSIFHSFVYLNAFSIRFLAIISKLLLCTNLSTLSSFFNISIFLVS